MLRADILHLASDLARRREPFALATVVRREPPSSAQVGDTALILPDSTVHGWVGGSCAQPTVVSEVRRALKDGRPRLISLSPGDIGSREGVSAFPMMCHSGGSVEIFIEPVLPAPRLLVFGTVPVAVATVRLARELGFAVEHVDRIEEWASREGQASHTEGASGATSERPFALVAAMGQNDEEALLAALSVEPTYLGVVSSRTRWEQLRGDVLDRVRDRAALDRVKCPAGLDIGARSAEEIALSVLAEIVQVRRTGAPRAVQELPVAQTERDPVCGMTVTVAAGTPRAEFAGRTYYFCCTGCRTRFQRDPASYAAAVGAGR